MPAVTGPGKPSLAHPVVAQEPSAQKPKPSAPSPNKTVFGMPAVEQPAPPPKQAPLAGHPPQNDNKRTVLGIPAVVSNDPEPAVPTPAAPGPSNNLQKTQVRPPGQQPGIQGAPTPQAPSKPDLDAIAGAAAEPDPAPKPAPSSKRPASKPPQPSLDTTSDDWPDEEVPPRSSPIPLIIGIASAVVVISVAVVLIYFFALDSGPALRPQVFPSPDGSRVTVTFALPEAPEGTVIRSEGQVIPVTAGQAGFEIPMSRLQLGTNSLPIEIVEPGQSPRQLSFPIILRHQIAVDASGLDAEPPFVAVNFRTAPDVQLAVEGNPVATPGGVYSHKIALSSIPTEEEGESLIYKVSFQLIDPKTGSSEQGQQLVTVPVTKLELNRPAKQAVVDTEVITVSGIADPQAQVTVNGNMVGVTAVGFSTSVPLPSLGEHEIKVRAKAPGKAPAIRDAKVQRIADLESAAKNWSKDADAKIDYPNLARDPNALVGKKIVMNGRIVNIKTERGITAFLLYVADSCPAGARCAVYVLFRGETDAGQQSWVDVYGTVRGTRAVDLPSGQKLEVPAVDASFVIKSKHPKARGRR